MARFIVEAVSRFTFGKEDQFTITVSVSRADTGWPVTGLTPADFQLSHRLGSLMMFSFNSIFSELEWETADTSPSGCYHFTVNMQRKDGQPLGSYLKESLQHPFGLRVRRKVEVPEEEGPRGRPGEFQRADPMPKMVQYDQGQTIIQFESVPWN